jgi:hypothetical protein
MSDNIEYSIKLQRLIENLKYDTETPYPELHHHKMIVAAKGRIRELEAALHEIADFSEQFIADNEDGDERMYKVNQIADTALAHAASGAITAANRGAKHA